MYETIKIMYLCCDEIDISFLVCDKSSTQNDKNNLYNVKNVKILWLTRINM